MMPRISKTELAQRLSSQVPIADDLTPEQALAILLYGWKKYRHYGVKYCDALKHRDWFYIVEVIDISDYAQVDLTKSEPTPLCEDQNLLMS